MFSSEVFGNEPVYGLGFSATPDEVVINGVVMGKGYERRDYYHQPYGSIPHVEPLQLPLIPRDQWASRIEAMENTQTRLSDICKQVNLPCKNQANTNYCHVADTEVLTSSGWVEWPNYNWIDPLGTVNQVTGRMEYQTPIEKHIHEHSGQINYSTNKRLDFGVTDDHRMLVRKWSESQRTLGESYSFVRAADVGWYAGVMSSPRGFIGTDLIEVEIEGDRRYDGDDFVAMLSLICSDGYAGNEVSEKGKSYVGFCCFREDRYDKVAALAARVGFKEQPSRRGVWVRYSAHALSEWVRSNCYGSRELGASMKRIPRILQECSERQIKHFVTFFGDQSHTREANKTFFSTSKPMMDDLQILLMKVGIRTRLTSRPVANPSYNPVTNQTITPRHGVHVLTVCHSGRVSMSRRTQWERETYKGEVYCATVPNGTLVTRRNGTILISGNCWINAPTHCVEVLRAVQNQSYVELSPASVGAKIKNFRNVGGWGSEGLVYIVEHGLVPASMWPVNAINRSYDTPQANAERSKYRVTEWWDLRPRDFDQLMTCLFMRVPVAVGYDWWSHEVTAIDPVIVDGVYGIRIRNSWGGTWGENGYGLLMGSKAVPDDAVAPRVTIPS